MTSAPLLAIEHLTRDYRAGLFGDGRAHRALDDVSLTVAAGEIVGIVGESGCGKSTLARLVAALDRPTGGRVILDGDDLFNLPPRALRRRRRDIQMVFQDPYGSLDPRQSIGRIVAEPLHVLDPPLDRAGRAGRVGEMLRSVGLRAEDAGLYAHQFSGGQRQRIAIARALVTVPRLVVADEPVSALDVSIQAQILNLLLDLRERDGTAFLFISHNLAVVQAIADRIGVMYRGRLVETGPAVQVFAAPLHPYTRLLVEAEPTIDPRAVPPLPPPVAGDPAPEQGGCAFRSRCWLATGQCRTIVPELRGIAAGRLAACHHPMGPSARQGSPHPSP